MSSAAQFLAHPLAIVLLAVCIALAISCVVLMRRANRLKESVQHSELALATLRASKDEELLTAQLQEVKSKLEEYEIAVREYAAQLSKSEAEKSSLQERLTEQAAFSKALEEKTKAHFENLANRIFEEKNTQSKQNLNELLTPLKEDIVKFKEHITHKFGEHSEKQFALKEEIKNIVEASNHMRLQTESLTKALKGDVKTQGNWGEMVLERILEASGLRKGEEYRMQGVGMGLKHPEAGHHQKPDYIVMLPENRHAIIDSKVSLTAFERLCAEEDEALKAEHARQFLQSVRKHVRDLEERRYQDMQGLDTPEYVLMFMPIEGAYALALQQDPELHADAWNRKVIIVCPSTLFGILKIIGSMWKLDRQNKNAQAIADKGGQLYDKIVGFIEDMGAIGKSLEKAQEQFDGAFKKLAKGRGNILRQTEQLRELGAKNTKQMPVRLLEDEPFDGQELPAAPKDAA